MKRKFVFGFIIVFSFLSPGLKTNAQTVKLSSIPFKEQLKLSLRSNYKPVKREIPIYYRVQELKYGAGLYFEAYQLSLDNMPCLRPKFPAESNFSIFYTYPGDFRMPNFFAPTPDL
jgi:hypothetical protein